MSVEEKTREAVNMITNQMTALSEIVERASQDRDFNTADERLERWKSRTVRLLSEKVNSIEGKKLEDIDEVVVLSRILNDSINSGYQGTSKRVVKEVNGERVKNLKQMIEVIESSEEPFLFIRTGDNVNPF